MTPSPWLPEWVHQMIASARQRALLAVLLGLTLLIGICIGYHILTLQQVAESAVNGAIALALAIRAVGR